MSDLMWMDLCARRLWRFYHIDQSSRWTEVSRGTARVVSFRRHFQYERSHLFRAAAHHLHSRDVDHVLDQYPHITVMQPAQRFQLLVDLLFERLGLKKSFHPGRNPVSAASTCSSLRDSLFWVHRLELRLLFAITSPTSGTQPIGVVENVVVTEPTDLRTPVSRQYLRPISSLQ